MSRLRSSVAPLIIGLMAATPSAHAQETEAPSAVPEQLDPPAAEEEASQTIVVTGSRIKRTEFNSPDPITVIDPSLSRAQGLFGTAEMIQSSSIAAGSAQVTTAISSGFVTNGGEGANTISLRGLGAERTLVLLNGRRAGPAGTRGAVASFDLNVIPQSIVQSVDILKSGASSIYGSDAIAGVVNLITKRATDGLELNGFTSVPQYGEGEKYSLNGAWGKDFGNGHIMIAADYYRQNKVRRDAREYLRCDEKYIFRDGSPGVRSDPVDPRTGSYRCDAVLWGHIWTYDYGGSATNLEGGRQPYFLQYSYPGENLGQYVPATRPATNDGDLITPPGWFQVGYDQATQGVFNYYHPYVGRSTFEPSTERMTGYLSASYEIAPSIELYTELLYNRRKNRSEGYYQPYQLFGWVEDTIRGTDEDGYPNDPFAVGFSGDVYISPTGIIDWGGSEIDVKYTRAVGGAKGDFGGFLKGWSWDAYVQYSRSKGTYSREVLLDDTINAANGRTGSCVGTTLEPSGRACIDIPWTDPFFLAGQWTAEQRAFLTDIDTGNTTYTQLSGEVTTTGTLVTLPAGNVGVALGVSYRKDKLTDIAGEVARAGNIWNGTSGGITQGTSETKEIFGEIEVPLIYNTPLIQSFSISGAARMTNNTTTRTRTGESAKDNANWTYKAGLNWIVNDWVRFRASYGTSFRSPAIFEQVIDAQTSFLAQRSIDICTNWTNRLATGGITQKVADNCAADGIPGNYTGTGEGATIITGGGLGVLKAETSVAKSASVILTPRFAFLPSTRISVAVDYSDIKIKGGVATLPASSVVAGCYRSDFFPDEPLCDLFERNSPTATVFPNNITTLRASYINIAERINRSIDVTAKIDQDLGKIGKVTLLAQVTRQLKDTSGLFADTIEDENGLTGEPKWVGNLKVVYEPVKDLSFFYGLDYIGSTSDEAEYIEDNGDLCAAYPTSYGPSCLDLSAPAVFYHSASVTKTIDRLEITLGVNNIFNTKPPRISSDSISGEGSTIGQGVFSSQYDYLGRKFFVNVRAKL